MAIIAGPLEARPDAVSNVQVDWNGVNFRREDGIGHFEFTQDPRYS